MSGEGSPIDSDNSDTPPLIEIIKTMIKQLPMKAFAQLVENWCMLAALSAERPLGAGSGCTGSGLDWMTLNMLTEVFALCLPFVF